MKRTIADKTQQLQLTLRSALFGGLSSVLIGVSKKDDDLEFHLFDFAHYKLFEKC